MNSWYAFLHHENIDPKQSLCSSEWCASRSRLVFASRIPSPFRIWKRGVIKDKDVNPAGSVLESADEDLRS